MTLHERWQGEDLEESEKVLRKNQDLKMPISEMSSRIEQFNRLHSLFRSSTIRRSKCLSTFYCRRTARNYPQLRLNRGFVSPEHRCKSYRPLRDAPAANAILRYGDPQGSVWSKPPSPGKKWRKLTCRRFKKEPKKPELSATSFMRGAILPTKSSSGWPRRRAQPGRMMASHGRRGVKALLIGSETQKVLTHSRIPVLVYR